MLKTAILLLLLLFDVRARALQFTTLVPDDITFEFISIAYSSYTEMKNKHKR